MSYRDRQYELATERDSKLQGKCLLCYLGVPGGSGQASDYHEILFSGMGGNLHDKIHYALYNIAPACRMHHNRFQHNRLIWMKAMLKAGLAEESDYTQLNKGLPLYPDYISEPYPPIMDCEGQFGYGDTFFDAIPETILLSFTTSSQHTTRFCTYCCPIATRCLLQTRSSFYMTTKS